MLYLAEMKGAASPLLNRLVPVRSAPTEPQDHRTAHPHRKIRRKPRLTLIAAAAYWH
jgi:hypothetical protein